MRALHHRRWTACLDERIDPHHAVAFRHLRILVRRERIRWAVVTWRVDRRALTRPVWKRRICTQVDTRRHEGVVIVLGLIGERRRREQLATRPVEDDKAIEFLRTRPERRQFLGVVADRRGIGDQAERSQVVDARGIGALDQTQVVRKRVIGFECRARANATRCRRGYAGPGRRSGCAGGRRPGRVGCGADTHLARKSSCSLREATMSAPSKSSSETLHAREVAIQTETRSDSTRRRIGPASSGGSAAGTTGIRRLGRVRQHNTRFSRTVHDAVCVLGLRTVSECLTCLSCAAYTSVA